MTEPEYEPDNLDDLVSDPKSAARYAIEATERIAAIHTTRIVPGMANLRVHHRRVPRADASDAAWSQYFATLDRLEQAVIDGLEESSRLRLNVVAATLPHVVGAFYRPPSSTASSWEPWQLAGYGAEKAATHDAIDALAAIGFHWGNGFANPGSEI